MTSISISLGLWEVLTQRKKQQNTMDEFLRDIVADYHQIKEEFSFTEDAFNRASKKNEEFARREELYRQRITELENKISVLESSSSSGNQVGATRAVAVKPYFPPNSILALPIPADSMATNLPSFKNTQEVTEKV